MNDQRIVLVKLISNLVRIVTDQVFFFIDFCGIDPALTNLAEVLHLVFETVYVDKKDWNKERRICRTESCRKIKLPCSKGNFHPSRIFIVVQISLWQSLQEFLVVIFRQSGVDGDGRVL